MIPYKLIPGISPRDTQRSTVIRQRHQNNGREIGEDCSNETLQKTPRLSNNFHFCYNDNIIPNTSSTSTSIVRTTEQGLSQTGDITCASTSSLASQPV